MKFDYKTYSNQLESENERLNTIIDELEEKIDKAIEYIKKGIDFNSLHFIAGKDEDMWKILLVDNVKEDLLEILGDKENGGE